MGVPEPTCELIRGKIRDSLRKHRYHNAVFLADKLVTMTDAQVQTDVLLLATAYFNSSQYKRCLNVLKHHGLVKHRFPTKQSESLAQRGAIEFVYLAAKSLEMTGDWQECLDLLGEGNDSDDVAMASQCDDGAGEYLPSIYYLRGKCMEMVDRRNRAAVSYKKALRLDPCHYEAFDRLIDGHLLDTKQEKAFIDSLRFAPEEDYIRLLYLYKLSTFTFGLVESSPLSIPSGGSGIGGAVTAGGGGKEELTQLETTYNLANNPSLKLMKAERAFNYYQLQKAFELTEQMVYNEDPYSDQGLILHICVLVEQRKKTNLFSLAHSLVESRPSCSLSWFCVGCYYYACQNYEKAGKFYSKATNMDLRFVPAWIAYGHTFSNVEESDQAMAAYRNAIRLNPGSHLGQLFIGMEHIRCGNLQLAQEFITTSKHICPCDPVVYNELGVVAYKLKKYEDARQLFQYAIQLCPKSIDGNEHWEYPQFNLGSCLRKLRSYKDALYWYNESVKLRPHNYSTYAAIGFTYHLMGVLDDAITYYHKALGYKSNDTFSLEMIDKAIQESYKHPTQDLLMDNPGWDPDFMIDDPHLDTSPAFSDFGTALLTTNVIPSHIIGANIPPPIGTPSDLIMGLGGHGSGTSNHNAQLHNAHSNTTPTYHTTGLLGNGGGSSSSSNSSPLPPTVTPGGSSNSSGSGVPTTPHFPFYYTPTLHNSPTGSTGNSAATPPPVMPGGALTPNTTTTTTTTGNNGNNANGVIGNSLSQQQPNYSLLTRMGNSGQLQLGSTADTPSSSGVHNHNRSNSSGTPPLPIGGGISTGYAPGYPPHAPARLHQQAPPTPTRQRADMRYRRDVLREGDDLHGRLTPSPQDEDEDMLAVTRPVAGGSGGPGFGHRLSFSETSMTD